MAHPLNQVAEAAAMPSDMKPRDGSAQHGGASRKDEYRAFCRIEASLPLFTRDWWLDAAVGPDGWDVALVKKLDRVVASMPYVLRSRYGLSIVTQPALTPVLGPWLRQHGGKTATQISHEVDLMQQLIDQLPRFDHFSQTWHSGVKNWQPFYWKGFQQTTYYSYVMPDLTNTAALWANLETNVRRIINKAGSEFHLQVRDDLPLDDFLALHHKTFARQGLSQPFSDDFVRRLDAACAERNCRKLFIAVDPQGVRHAGCYLVWDEHSAYGLMQATDPSLRASGANSLCLWASVLHAAGVTRQYDFAGSMIAPIERFMRDFGGNQEAYFHIRKTPSHLLRIRQGMLSLIGKK